MDSKVKWVSAIIGNDQYKTELIMDNHSFIADEPLDAGGKDLGPSPGDLLRLSLASCTAITLRMYANRKGFNIEQIEVKVSSENVTGKNIFRCNIYITGNIDQYQRKRMLQIANACPVHKILINPSEVQTQLF